MTWEPAGDRWVDSNFARLAEIIQDYDEELELAWIPPENRTTEEDRKHPYAIMGTEKNGERYCVFTCGPTESAEDILTKLFANDTHRSDVWGSIEARNTARQALMMKEELDYLEERRDLYNFLQFSDKNYVTFKDGEGKVVKLDENRRRINGRSRHQD